MCWAMMSNVGRKIFSVEKIFRPFWFKSKLRLDNYRCQGTRIVQNSAFDGEIPAPKRKTKLRLDNSSAEPAANVQKPALNPATRRYAGRFWTIPAQNPLQLSKNPPKTPRNSPSLRPVLDNCYLQPHPAIKIFKKNSWHMNTTVIILLHQMYYVRHNTINVVAIIVEKS